MPRSKIETVSLPIPLTEAEVTERGRELAATLVRLDEARARHKVESKRLKDDADDIEKKTLALGHVIKSGVEQRPVECEWRADIGLRVLKLVRRDTGEVVRSEVMTGEELEEASQGNFPFVDNVAPLSQSKTAKTKKSDGN